MLEYGFTYIDDNLLSQCLVKKILLLFPGQLLTLDLLLVDLNLIEVVAEVLTYVFLLAVQLILVPLNRLLHYSILVDIGVLNHPWVIFWLLITRVKHMFHILVFGCGVGLLELLGASFGCVFLVVVERCQLLLNLSADHGTLFFHFTRAHIRKVSIWILMHIHLSVVI